MTTVACPKCGHTQGTKQTTANNRLYTKASRTIERMHRFHSLCKLASFNAVGCIVWFNDFLDRVVATLLQNVDNATQSTLWSWTFGWVTPALPAASPIYEWYNFGATVVGIFGMAWVSRWFFWTTVKNDLEAGCSDVRSSLNNRAEQLTVIWAAEYILLGLVVRFFFASSLPFTIPWYPTFTAITLFGVAYGTLWYLEQSECKAS
jgi:hypothetical protein